MNMYENHNFKFQSLIFMLITVGIFCDMRVESGFAHYNEAKFIKNGIQHVSIATTYRCNRT